MYFEHAFSDQIDLFEKDADYWWKPGGPFDLLHTMNSCRIPFVQKHCKSLDGLRILDIGCGGGILAEPLARLGAFVTGIDASPSAIKCAQNHALLSGLNIEYVNLTIEEFQKTLKDSEFYDLVIASEIIEHVPDPRSFLKAALLCLKPKSHGLVISTINQTLKSYAGAILGAEYLLRLVPKGTHEWSRFLKPSDINDILCEINDHSDNKGYQWRDLAGMKWNIISKEWSFTKNLDMNYIGIIRN